MTAGRAVGIVVALAVLGYGVFIGRLYLHQDATLFPGTRIAVDPQPPRIAGLEVLQIPTPAGNVDAFFLPAEGAAVAARQPVVLFSHGRSDVIDQWVQRLEGFRTRGIGVLLVEFPGYGRSAGAPTETSIRATMDAAYDRIAADPRVDAERLVGYGQSLGGAVICLLSRDRPLRALILQSTFLSLDLLPSRYLVPAFLLHGHFDSLGAVARYPGPILVIHGAKDPLIPWQEGRRLAAAAPHATFRLYDCGHDCWDPDRLPFWRDVEPMLRMAGVLPAVPARTD